MPDHTKDLHQEIVIAGFGGQGIILAGKLLALAALKAGFSATLFPAYGPEMRGGTAYCTLVISRGEIYSPVVRSPDILIALNQPSLDKFAPDLKPGGLLLYNSSLATVQEPRGDLDYLDTPCSQIASKLGDIRVANVVALSSLVQRTNLVTFDHLEQAIQQELSPKGEKIVALNLRALHATQEQHP